MGFYTIRVTIDEERCLFTVEQKGNNMVFTSQRQGGGGLHSLAKEVIKRERGKAKQQILIHRLGFFPLHAFRFDILCCEQLQLTSKLARPIAITYTQQSTHVAHPPILILFSKMGLKSSSMIPLSLFLSLCISRRDKIITSTMLTYYYRNHTRCCFR